MLEPDPGPWCERDRASELLRERANASTDFSFLAVGLFMIKCAVDDWQRQRQPSSRGARLNLLRAQPLLSLLNGVCNIGHAMGTFFNHSCRCHPGHVMDVAGMYSVILWLAVFLCYRAARAMLSGSGSVVAAPPRRWEQWIIVLMFALCYVPLWNASHAFYADPWCQSVELTLVSLLIACAALPNLWLLWHHRRNKPRASRYVCHVQALHRCRAAAVVPQFVCLCVCAFC